MIDRNTREYRYYDTSLRKMFYPTVYGLPEDLPRSVIKMQRSNYLDIKNRPIYEGDLVRCIEGYYKGKLFKVGLKESLFTLIPTYTKTNIYLYLSDHIVVRVGDVWLGFYEN